MSSITTTFRVDGLTCRNCVSAVTAELMAVDGVDDVAIALTPGGTSTVTVTGVNPLTDEQVTTALDEAGDYRLAKTTA